ncbi:hypothetical protein [Arsenicibacter rosenii]|uniref:Uncharacterized protein n=1 Tax=Arsenicibacter rosenii TaxID=1750698 RepID=A0A1S2VAX2_9BACT|nr:hypothetical protein [Arsenicibacter rosenii]OIN55874.1 hypothetical protein BLX24_27860 [Arsenicibacter rosenii]
MTYSEILELINQLKTIESPAINSFFPVVKNPALWMGEAVLGFNPFLKHFELHVNEAQYNIMEAKQDESEAAAVLHTLKIKVLPGVNELIEEASELIRGNKIPGAGSFPAERCGFYFSRMI